MLSQYDAQAWLERWPLSPAGRQYIHQTRTSEPQRRVGSGTERNTPIRFASRRMGRVIQGESETVEGAFVRLCEYDETNVLEYWDQPPTVALIIVNRSGRRQRVPYTPDYLVLRQDGPVIVECKSVAEILQLLATCPADWTAIEGGHRRLSAYEYFAALGIRHEVFVPDERSALRSSNIDLLLAARRAAVPAEAAKWRTRVCTYLVKTQVTNIVDVCREAKLPDATLLLHGIQEGWLYAPLDQYLLARPHDALIALNQEQFDLGCEALAQCRATPVSGVITGQDRMPCAKDAAIMLQRHKELSGECPPTASARTHRRYRQRLRQSNGNLRALLPRHRPGNRKLRLTPDHEAFLQESIGRHYLTGTALSTATSHLRYENDFNDAKARGEFAENEFAVSLNTYLDRIRKRDAEAVARARGGARAANAAAMPVDRQFNAAPPCRPFQIAHADHYLGDRTLVVRVSGKERLTRKPWISVLQDDYEGGEVLAMAIGFRAPSRKVLAELLRDCVRRHGRLPETIVSDAGSDFRSVFYESTLALYGVHKKDRPTAAPRFGGKLERLFGTLKTSILWSGVGSTRNDGKGRAASPSHRSRQLAEQDLIDFYHELEGAIFGQLNLHLRGERLNTPNAATDAGLALFPMSGVPVDYDHAFMVATSVAAPEKEYTVDRSRGINPLGRWYWHPKLARAIKKVEVRLDPWDEDLAYAYVGDEWVCCRARGTLYQEVKDLVAMICRATLRLDTRTELAEAQHEADLALARYLCARQRTASPDTHTHPSLTQDDSAEDPIDELDAIDAIPVKWSP